MTSGSSELRGYAICTAPRSGSNWLCQHLSATGVLGHPLEYFNAPGRRRTSDPAYPGPPARQVQKILTAGRTPNGIYGVKMFAAQFQQASHAIKLTRELPSLRFVYLRREDVLGQAISWARAQQTEQYRSTQPVQGAPSYDRRTIGRQLKAVAEEYRMWTAYFARTGIAPLEIVYERLFENPQDGVGRIAALFGLPAPKVPTNGALKIQRDEISQEWRERFIREMGDPDKI